MITKKLITAPNFIWEQQLNPFITTLGIESKVFNAKKFIRDELDFKKMIDNFNDSKRTKLVALLLEHYDIQIIKSENGFTFASQNPEKGMALLEQLVTLNEKEFTQNTMSVVSHEEEVPIIEKEQKVNV
jgi:hypothetical protein